MKYYYPFIFILSSCILISCKKYSPLDKALIFAEENRTELEKVLEYYSLNKSDSLKYKAACYLIENMPYHFTYGGAEVDFYLQEIETLLNTSKDKSESLQIIKKLNDDLIKGKERIDKMMDVKTITSEFLINHIDASFKTREYPWAKDVNFEDFCQYVLPYRLSNEPLQNWIPFYTEHVKHIADSLYLKSTSIKDFVGRLVSHFSPPHILRRHRKGKFVIELRPTAYMNLEFGSCKELFFWTAYTFKALGLPVAWDYTPNWANRSLGHEWASMIIEGKYYPFLFLDKCKFGEHISVNPYEKPSKIYRHSYSLQNESLACQDIQGDILPIFNSPFIKDISDMYVDQYSDSCTNTILELDYPELVTNKILYLMVFDNTKWVPVGWGIKNNKAVSLEKIRRNCCYIVSNYDKKEFKPVSKPFYIDSGNQVIKINPLINELRTIQLKRKYPYFMSHRADSNIYKVIGGKFEVANKMDFSDAVELLTVKEIKIMGYQVMELESPLNRRYFRYISAPNGHVFMSEIIIYDDKNSEIPGIIIGTTGSFNKEDGDMSTVFDKNPFTFFNAPFHSNCWVGLDFGEQKMVNKFAYLPVNDDNHINLGEEYELFYFDREWITLGKKVGDNTFFLEYNNVPANALLLLRNQTKGEQERIFTYEDGNQKWW